jgi:hypothetical protein
MMMMMVVRRRMRSLPMIKQQHDDQPHESSVAPMSASLSPGFSRDRPAAAVAAVLLLLTMIIAFANGNCTDKMMMMMPMLMMRMGDHRLPRTRHRCSHRRDP